MGDERRCRMRRIKDEEDDDVYKTSVGMCI